MSKDKSLLYYPFLSSFLYLYLYFFLKRSLVPISKAPYLKQVHWKKCYRRIGSFLRFFEPPLWAFNTVYGSGREAKPRYWSTQRCLSLDVNPTCTFFRSNWTLLRLSSSQDKLDIFQIMLVTLLGGVFKILALYGILWNDLHRVSRKCLHSLKLHSSNL